MEWLEQPLNQLLSHFVDSNKRLFWLYIITSLCIVALFTWRSSSLKSQLKVQLSKETLLHKSAKQDYSIWIINIAIKWAIITPLLFSSAPIAIELSQGLESIFGNTNSPIATSYVPIAFTLLLFLLDDFSRFLLHYLSHKLPVLWRFHQVHHSAQVLTPVTVYRIHPVESMLYAFRLVFTQGLALGLGFYLFGYKLSVVDVFGANIFVFLFNVFGANLRHSQLYISWGKYIEHWFISPAQHQIHHSTAKAHYDKNFGSALAIWDRLFGTLLIATVNNRPTNFGLTDNKLTSLPKLYFAPFSQNKTK